MSLESRPELFAQPGMWVRWRHPRLAIARGWFAHYGPGPFEVVRLLSGGVPSLPVAYLVKTPSGAKVINVRWVGTAM